MVDDPSIVKDPVQNLLDQFSKLQETDRLNFIGKLPIQANIGSQPSQKVVDFAWRSIIGVFVAVFILVSLAIIVSMWFGTVGSAKPDVLITVFSTTVGFLAGVLTPSPVGKA